MRASLVIKSPKKISCIVETETGAEEVFFEFWGDETRSFSGGGSWIVAALLLSCMKKGEALVLTDPVSPFLLRKLEQIQDIYRTWIPGHSAVRVIGPAREQAPGREGTALLFSGGVDSVYSLLKHNGSVSDLIVIHGFEFPWREEMKFQEHLESVRAVAKGFNKRVMVVRTNVHDYLVRHTPWDFSHGAALASVALCLEGAFSRCLIASSYSYEQLHPWGSHPLLDPLWSTATLQLVHDGSEAKRVEKLRKIAANSLAMAHLRACDNPQSSKHCGKCEKCLRTMTALHVIGKLKDCPTMPSCVSPRLVRSLRLNEGGAVFFRELLQFPIEPPALRRAVYYALRNQRFGLRPVARHRLGIKSGAARLADMWRLVGRIFAGPG